MEDMGVSFQQHRGKLAALGLQSDLPIVQQDGHLAVRQARFTHVHHLGTWGTFNHRVYMMERHLLYTNPLHLHTCTN